ncbi:hybrid sensor histidine kinase/response regulator, partial [Escherichia coli]|nr:hybrid sensor histidine kinase/response regulator [Escherichia coli]
MPQPETVKILVVDDVEKNLIAMDALLRRDGVEILKAPSGPAALELLLR